MKRSTLAQLAVLVAFLAAFFTREIAAEASPPDGQIERVTTDAYGKKVSDNVVAVEIGKGVGFDTIKRVYGPGFKMTTGRDLTAMDVFSANKEQVFPACLTGRKKKPVRGDATVWKDCQNESDQTIGLMAGPTGRIVIPTVKARSFAEVEAALTASEACDRDIACLQKKIAALPVSDVRKNDSSVEANGVSSNAPLRDVAEPGSVGEPDDLNEAYIRTLEDRLGTQADTISRQNWLITILGILLSAVTLVVLRFSLVFLVKRKIPQTVPVAQLAAAQPLSLATLADDNKVLQEEARALHAEMLRVRTDAAAQVANAVAAFEKLELAHLEFDRERANFSEEMERLRTVEREKFDLGERFARLNTELGVRTQHEIDLETENATFRQELGFLRSYKELHEKAVARREQEQREGKEPRALRRQDRSPTPPNGQPACFGPPSGDLPSKEAEAGASSTHSPSGEAEEALSGSGRPRKLTLLPPPSGNAAVPPPTNGAGQHVPYSPP